MLAIVVHGGAGERDAPEEHAPRRAGLERAVEVGWEVLARGASALDAVVEAVALLEDDPHFNAGVGSVLTLEGEVEMDASVMAGDTLAAGAVALVRDVANPIRLARAVLDGGHEVFLAGPATTALAREKGLRLCAPEALITEAARARWQARRPANGETVGAVACDAAGHLAAATSTGGHGGKRRGRIGDSAVIGAGTAADDRLGAGSATGPGEAIMRLGLVRLAIDLLRRGYEPKRAAEYALSELERRTATRAGLIVLDGLGRVGIAYTTPGMGTAYRTAETGTVVVPVSAS